MKRIKPLIPEPVVTPQCCVAFDETKWAEHYLKRRAERYLADVLTQTTEKTNGR